MNAVETIRNIIEQLDQGVIIEPTAFTEDVIEILDHVITMENTEIHEDDTITYTLMPEDEILGYEVEEISTTPHKDDWLHPSYANEREYDPSGGWYNYDNNALEMNEINSLDQLQDISPYSPPELES